MNIKNNNNFYIKYNNFYINILYPSYVSFLKSMKEKKYIFLIFNFNMKNT